MCIDPHERVRGVGHLLGPDVSARRTEPLGAGIWWEMVGWHRWTARLSPNKVEGPRAGAQILPCGRLINKRI